MPKRLDKRCKLYQIERKGYGWDKNAIKKKIYVKNLKNNPETLQKIEKNTENSLPI